MEDIPLNLVLKHKWLLNLKRSLVWKTLQNTKLASIHITKFKHTIYRLGSQPKLSLRRFLCGLGLFLISAGLITAGYFFNHLLQVIGLSILPVALYFAIYGYLGIFANRFSQVISEADARAKHRDIF